METFGKVMSLPHDKAKIELENKAVQGEYQGIPVMASGPNSYVDAADIDTKVIGHCKMFNLSNPEDRDAYADLIAQLAWSPNMIKHLEERSFVDNSLIIYIAYLEYIKIAE